MPTTRWMARLACAGVLQLVAAATTLADDPPPIITHVRGETSDVRFVIDEAARRSPTIRAQIDRLDDSDVTVYVRFRLLTDGVDGRVRFLASTALQRYLVIDIACTRTRHGQMAMLGHELHHALEIAGAPSIVSVRTLSEHYERIGMRTTSADSQTFETQAARDTALKVRKEVW